MVNAGSVIYAACLDSQGFNMKTRPLVVIANEVSGQPILCVGISSQYDEPLPPTQVKLPYAGSSRRCHTGLTKPSVAVCDWLVSVEPGADWNRIGDVRPALLRIIIDIVNAINRPADE